MKIVRRSYFRSKEGIDGYCYCSSRILCIIRFSQLFEMFGSSLFGFVQVLVEPREDQINRVYDPDKEEKIKANVNFANFVTVLKYPQGTGLCGE